MLPSETRRPSTVPLMPCPGSSTHVRSRGRPQTSSDRRRHERLAQHVRREPVDRGGQSQELCAIDGADGKDLRHLGRSHRERARLVEQHRARAAERLDRARALHHDPSMRGPRETRDQRDRRCEDQRTRGRHDDDRKRTNGFTAQHPRGRRDDQGGGQEEPRVAVGHPHEWRALRLRLLDEPHECRIRALGCGPIGTYVERGTSVRSAAQHVHPRGQSDRAAAHR